MLEKRRLMLLTEAAQRKLGKSLIKAQEANKTLSQGLNKDQKPVAETLRKVEKG
jgi:hypothetical protein